MKKIPLALSVLFSLGMTGLAQAQLVYEATTDNVTLFSNDVNGTTAANLNLSGAAPDLLLTGDGGNFFNSGFTSTDDVNTLNGTPVLATDTVTVEFVVDAVTNTDVSELRSRGIEFGLSAETIFDAADNPENLVLRIGGGGNSQNVNLSFVDEIPYTITTDPLFDATPESVLDGFGVTLVANAAGFTFSFTGLDADPEREVNGEIIPAQVVTDYSGTWLSQDDFLTNVGGGHFYVGVQKRMAGSTTLDISVASVSVEDIPPPMILRGDVNLDGIVNFLDISPFIGELSAGGTQPEADTNISGDVNFLDIAPFISILSGGSGS